MILMSNAPELVRAVAAVLAMAPASPADSEPAAERAERLEVVATAIVEAVRSTPSAVPELTRVSALVVAAVAESGLALRIHEQRCRPGECDHGRAVGLWQVHLRGAERERCIGTSLSATTALARHADRALEAGWSRCESRSGAHSAYLTGRACGYDGGRRRARAESDVLEELRFFDSDCSPW